MKPKPAGARFRTLHAYRPLWGLGSPRTLAPLSILLVLAGCASEANTPPEATWHPIPGAAVTSWEQTRAICDPILLQGQAEVLGGGGVVATGRAIAQFRSCMGQHRWTDSAASGPGNDERAAARRQDAEQLNGKLKESRTKNALTLLVGDAPNCQPGDPGTEICRWRWTRQLPTENIPLQMTCVLPQDGTPREEGSCRYSVESEAR